MFKKFSQAANPGVPISAQSKHDKDYTINILNYIIQDYSKEKNFQVDLNNWIKESYSNYYELRDCCLNFSSENYVKSWLYNHIGVDIN